MIEVQIMIVHELQLFAREAMGRACVCGPQGHCSVPWCQHSEEVGRLRRELPAPPARSLFQAPLLDRMSLAVGCPVTKLDSDNVLENSCIHLNLFTYVFLYQQGSKSHGIIRG